MQVIEPVICWGTNEMLGPALSEDPALLIREPQDGAMCWRSGGPAGGVLDGEALTVILRSPLALSRSSPRPEELERGRARGIPPRLARRFWKRNIAMVMFPAVRT